MLRFTIAATPPFSLLYTVRVLQRLPSNCIDRWDRGEFRRLLTVGDRVELVTVSQISGTELLVTGRLEKTEVSPVSATLTRMFGTEVDLGPFYQQFRRAAPLSALASALQGLKPPRHPTLFEALVNAICCQQVSLTVGLMLMERLAAAAGRTRVVEGEKYLSFPSPAHLMRLKPEQLRAAGFSGTKAAVLALLAEGFATERYREEEVDALPTEEALDRLQRIPGIGAWSARYSLLRGLGRLDVFPTGDNGAASTLAELTGQPMTPAEAEAFARHWKEYAGLLYFHLMGNRCLPERAERLPIARVPVPLRLR